MKKLVSVLLCIMIILLVIPASLTSFATENEQTDSPVIIFQGEYNNLQNLDGYCIAFSAKNYITNTVYLYHNDELYFSAVIDPLVSEELHSTMGEAGEYYYVISSKNSKSETVSEKKYFNLENSGQISFLDSSKISDRESISLNDFPWGKWKVNWGYNYSKIKEYTGKPICPKVTSVQTESYLSRMIIDENNCVVLKMEGCFAKFTVSYLNNKNVGTATVIIKGKDNFVGTIKETFKIVKAKNPLTVKGSTKTVKYKTLKKKAVSIKALTVKKNMGSLSYKKVSGNKKITVNTKTGKLTVKKGTKKGTYTIKIKVTAKGTGNYKSGAKTATVKIKVK